MATVESVRGPVELADLGPTLMHEHIFVLSTEHVQNYGHGPMIVLVRGTRVALGREEAAKVLVNLRKDGAQ